MQIQLKDFMQYPDFACKVAGMLKYNLLSRREVQNWKDLSLVKRFWFIFGAMNLIYQNIGLITYMWLPEQRSQEMYVAQISETGSVFGLTFVGVCNMWMLLYYRQRIEAMLAELERLYPKCQNESYRIRYYMEQSGHLMKYTAIFFMSAYTYYNALPILELLYELFFDMGKVKYNCQSNTWYPWSNNSYKPIKFIIGYLNQVISSLFGVGFIMASQFLLCFFTTQFQLHFDALSCKLLKLDARQAYAYDELKSLIAYHNRLMHLKDNVNSIFNFTFLMNFFTSTIAICLMAFSMIMINLAAAFKYSVGMLSFLVFTLFICYNGTQLTIASEKLLPAAFYNNWYDGHLRYRKMLFFLMMRCYEPQVLRAYKFTPVSIATYMMILRFSYRLFTFVRTMI